MRTYTLVLLLLVVFVTLCMLAEVEGWGRSSRNRPSGRRSSSSRSRSVSRSRGSSSRRGGRRSSSSRSVSRSSSSRRSSSRRPSSRRSSSRRSSSRRTSSSRRGGWFGGRRSSSSRRTPAKRTGGYSSRKTARGKTVTVGKTKVNIGKGGIRGRDETGHRTGLGTLAKEAIRNPKQTYKALKEFAKSYKDMRKKNLKGGNLAAHREANKKATQKSNAKVAGAISALREQYKRFRVKKNPDGSWHVGDTRTKKETKATMNANKQGRQDAQKKSKSRDNTPP